MQITTTYTYINSKLNSVSGWSCTTTYKHIQYDSAIGSCKKIAKLDAMRGLVKQLAINNNISDDEYYNAKSQLNKYRIDVENRKLDRRIKKGTAIVVSNKIFFVERIMVDKKRLKAAGRIFEQKNITSSSNVYNRVQP